MLRVLAGFILGAAVGYLNSPRPETPKDIQIINKIQSPPAVMCPKIFCETEIVKDSLKSCLSLIENLTNKISNMDEDKAKIQQSLQNEKEDSVYWKKKYMDFDCGK